MVRIATLTLNPTIDGSSDAERLQHTHKVRTFNERFDPGGGGINVARVLARLGGEVEAVYLAGGVTGPVLSGLLERDGLPHQVLPIAGDTRISLAVHERSSGKEYRFVPQGPKVSPAEWRQCLDAVARLDCAWLVVSGSLPPGLPEDSYACIVEIARNRGIAVVLDTSGSALAKTLERGGLRLVKPSLGELEQLAGKRLDGQDHIIAAARAIVEAGQAEIVAVSMGHRGAALVDIGQALVLPAIPVEARSAVGAGDSFVAAMTFGLAQGWETEQAFRLGMAAGSAAVLTPGTDLCHREDVARLAQMIGVTCWNG
ncbi:MAG TPA: 1-phosphofructokinase family hexose kinase [Novosphingobium sp.]|nr:1-phosphofructokinase family hexose kinase [Novosphingobium sp.]